MRASGDEREKPRTKGAHGRGDGVAHSLNSPASRPSRWRAWPSLERLKAATTLVTVVAIPVLSGCGQGTPGATPTSTGIAASDVSRYASEVAHSSATASKSVMSPAATSSKPAATDPFEVPAAAKAHTMEGAKAFVSFYWSVLDQLDAHPQDGVIQRFAAKTCTSCAMQEETAAALAKSGGRVVTRNPQLTNLAVRSDSVPDSVVVTFHQADSGSTKISATGQRQNLPPNALSVAARADWDGTQWKLGESGADQN